MLAPAVNPSVGRVYSRALIRVPQGRKGETPISKLQSSKKHQIPNFNRREFANRYAFDWILQLEVYLEFEVWSLSFCQAASGARIRYVIDLRFFCRPFRALKWARGYTLPTEVLTAGAGIGGQRFLPDVAYWSLKLGASPSPVQPCAAGFHP